MNTRFDLIIVGAGFAGLKLALERAKKGDKVALIDKNNYHNFQPLMYQVATAGLETGTISYPIRKLIQRYRNLRFYWADVKKIEVDKKMIWLHTSVENEYLIYDKLVLAKGTTNNFFQFEDKKDLFMSLKSIPEALDLRSHILQNLELAVMEDNPLKREELLNIAIVGGGPTGVELAGALAEMKIHVLPKDYPELDIKQMKISLFQRGPRLLEMLDESLSKKAVQYLEDLGVQVHLKTAVTNYDGDALELNGNEKFLTDTVIWAAGVRAISPEGLNKATFLPNGRVMVSEYTEIIGYQDIFAIGDLACMKTASYPDGHPQIAPVAMDQATYLSQFLEKARKNKPQLPFVYQHKGSMAVVGRNKALVDLPGCRLTGFFAWFIWMFVHLMSLVGFRNKLAALVTWTYSYFTYDKALRLIIRTFQRKNQA